MIENATIMPDSLELSLNPPISVYAHHAGKRISAGVYFEIAARFAQKVNGTIIQRALVPGCSAIGETGSRDLVVANYPNTPLTWDRICPGFAEELMR